MERVAESTELKSALIGWIRVGTVCRAVRDG